MLLFYIYDGYDHLKKQHAPIENRSLEVWVGLE